MRSFRCNAKNANTRTADSLLRSVGQRKTRPSIHVSVSFEFLSEKASIHTPPDLHKRVTQHGSGTPGHSGKPQVIQWMLPGKFLKLITILLRRRLKCDSEPYFGEDAWGNGHRPMADHSG